MKVKSEHSGKSDDLHNTLPEQMYRTAELHRRHGNISKAEAEGQAGYQEFLNTNPALAGKFRLLQLTAMTVRARNSYQQVLAELQKTPPEVFSSCDLLARKLMIEAYAEKKLGMDSEAESSIGRAETSCISPDLALVSDLWTTRGQFSSTWLDTERCHRLALKAAKDQGDSFREANALNNLAVAKQGQERYDESIEYGEASLSLSRSMGYGLAEEKAEGNLGFNYFKLGDFDRASQLLQEAYRKAHELGAGSDMTRWPNILGLVYEELGQPDQAEASYRKALTNALQQEDQEQTIVALGELSYLSIRMGKWEQAESFAAQTLDLARQAKNRPMELQALLAQGLIASHRGDMKTAEPLLVRVARDPYHDYESATWQAQSELANLYAQEGKIPAAQAEYKVALKTVRDARCSVQKEASRLPFFANASRVYNSYIDFLVEHGKTAEALRTADESRALTLAEGLGVEGKKCLASEAVFNPQRSARAANATLLFYWLGAEHSYLWGVAPDHIRIYPLPPAAKIEAAVEAYRKALVGSRDVLDAGDANGAMLYETLVAPAEEFFQLAKSNATPRASAKGSEVPRVIVIADSSLSGLNFETLIHRKPKPHYWLEDVCVENASSLRLLAAGAERHSPAGGKLLLIGNPVPPGDGGFALLPNAAKEMQSVQQSFPAAGTLVYDQRQSTPKAYINSHPEQFAYIHFVAHGVASLTDPLDSAVVLSPAPAAGQPQGKTPGKDGGYKLYARDVMAHPLKADLVTVSTCKGAGVRTYTGEGLVGLSWAFLHAGAHHVIGALWDVSDESTPQLMAAMYAELVKGSPPEAALRTAKLSLLHSGGPFRKPFYWAPFQLYTGS